MEYNFLAEIREVVYGFARVRGKAEMNADLIKSILGLGIALIPLFIVIVRAFLTRTARTTGILESSRLKALKIERIPFNKDEFNQVYHILIKFYLSVFFVKLAIGIAAV